MNDHEEADGPDPSAGDYLGEVIEPGSSHGLEPLADDYTDGDTVEIDAVQGFWPRDVGADPLGWLDGQVATVVDAVAAEWRPIVGYCRVHRVQRCTVCLEAGGDQASGWRPATPLGPPHGGQAPASNAGVVSAVATRPEQFALHWQAIARSAQRELGDGPGSALDAFEHRVLRVLSQPGGNLGYKLRKAFGQYDKRVGAAMLTLREASRHIDPNPKRATE